MAQRQTERDSVALSTPTRGQRRSRRIDPERVTPLAHSIPAASSTSGLSRTMLYEAMKAGELAYVKIGSRRLILDTDLRDLLARHRVAA
jgi:hypothetical protein